MAYFPDMSPCTYFGRSKDRLIAIGWLDHGNEYQKGDVPEDFFSSLVTLLKKTRDSLFCIWDSILAGIAHLRSAGYV
jgi:hypothetical protein